MRVLVVSDIHSNLEAFDAVLAAGDEMGCERLMVLGDIVGYGADPNAVVERIVDRDGVAIAGNHDLAAVGGFDVSWFNEAAAAAIRWTAAELTAETNGFLTSLSPRRDTREAVFVHGSVRDPVAEYLLSVPDARASFDLASFTLAFFGHTHLPTVFRRDDDGRVTGWVLPEGEELRFEPGIRHMVNPGSVGQPRDRDPRAGFIVWEDGHAMGHRVGYDTERAAAKIRAAGLPAWLAQRLARGE